MVEKEEVCKRILSSLNMCNVKQTEEYFEIELPVVTFFNQQLVTLRLYPFDDGYYKFRQQYRKRLRGGF